MRRGTTVRYGLSEPAAVTLRVERLVGRAPRRRDAAADRHGGRKPRALQRPDRPPGAGAGRYRLIVRATDAAGNSSGPARAAFRVVR